VTAGFLIAFEGLDQSGKQTQAERLAARVRERGRAVHVLSFPDYQTAIGAEIGRALHGECDYAGDVMQLLYVANRYEYRPAIETWTREGGVVICDRYLASSVAYGEAQGLDAEWLLRIQEHLPQPSLTLLLDIPPDASLPRKQPARDRYLRYLPLLARVRESYVRQSKQPGWEHIDGAQDRDAVTQAVARAVASRLGLL
jgi:dTMP kinase